MKPFIYDLNHSIHERQQFLIWRRLDRPTSWEDWSASMEPPFTAEDQLRDLIARFQQCQEDTPEYDETGDALLDALMGQK